MTSKEIFLAINKEILLKTNNPFIYSSKEEEGIVNFRNGIRAAMLGLSRSNEIAFFEELQTFYETTKVPLLSKEAHLILYKNFLRNNEIFKCLTYLLNKLKHKAFSNEKSFWELVIRYLISPVNGTFENSRHKLDMFVVIALQLFVKHGYESFHLIFNYTLNNSIDTTLFCWSSNDMGSIRKVNFLLPLKAPVMTHIWKTYRFLNEMNAPPKLYEVILFQYIESTPTSFLHHSNYFTFFDYLYRRIPISTIQRESLRSNELLFEVYRINPKIFELIDFKQVNEEYLEILNSSPWSEIRLGEYSSFLVEKMFKAYGISVYFAKAHVQRIMTINEKAWFNDVLSGKNLIYSANLPFKLSKKVAHEFNTSQHIISNSVTDALVRTALFSEVQDMNFATVITRKIRNFSESDFWIKTMGLLYRKGLRADTIELNELYDYIHFQEFQLERKIDFTTKKLSNLVDESNQWHVAIHFAKVKKRLRLKRLPISNIKPYFLERNDSRYVIKQLKTNYELAIEGEQMKHCVFTYTYDCLNSGSYIFSLRNVIKNDDSKKTTEITMITIEVNNNKIEQKLGEFNRSCNQLEDDLIEEWAKQHNLTL
jgi:hypothetical protein